MAVSLVQPVPASVKQESVLTEQEAVTLAISKLIKDDEVKVISGKLQAGDKISGEATITFTFSLSKGKPSEVAPTANILSLPVLAKALILSGIQIENFKENLRRAATEALLNGESVGDVVSEADQRVFAAVEEIKSEIVAQLPKVPRAGSVRVQGVIKSATLTTY